MRAAIPTVRVTTHNRRATSATRRMITSVVGSESPNTKPRSTAERNATTLINRLNDYGR